MPAPISPVRLYRSKYAAPSAADIAKPTPSGFAAPVRMYRSKYEGAGPAVAPVAPRVQPAPTPQESEVGIFGDAYSSFAQGGIGAIKSVTDVFGADNAVSETLGNASDYWSKRISPERQAELALQEQEKAALGPDAGILDRAGLYAKQAIRNPVTTLAEGFGNIAPLAAGGAVLKGLAGARTVATGIGAVMGAGAVKGGIYDTTLQSLISQGVDPEVAKAKASEAQSYAANPGLIATGVGAGALAGRFGADPAIAGMTGTAAREMLEKEALNAGFKGLGKGMFQEAVTEAPQESLETRLANEGAIGAGAEIDPNQGVLEAGVKAGIMSAVPGGVGTVGSGINARRQLRDLAGPLDSQGLADATKNLPAMDPASETDDFAAGLSGGQRGSSVLPREKPLTKKEQAAQARVDKAKAKRDTLLANFDADAASVVERQEFDREAADIADEIRFEQEALDIARAREAEQAQAFDQDARAIALDQFGQDLEFEREALDIGKGLQSEAKRLEQFRTPFDEAKPSAAPVSLEPATDPWKRAELFGADQASPADVAAVPSPFGTLAQEKEQATEAVLAEYYADFLEKNGRAALITELREKENLSTTAAREDADAIIAGTPPKRMRKKRAEKASSVEQSAEAALSEQRVPDRGPLYDAQWVEDERGRGGVIRTVPLTNEAKAETERILLGMKDGSRIVDLEGDVWTKRGRFFKKDDGDFIEAGGIEGINLLARSAILPTKDAGPRSQSRGQPPAKKGAEVTIPVEPVDSGDRTPASVAGVGDVNPNRYVQGEVPPGEAQDASEDGNTNSPSIDEILKPENNKQGVGATEIMGKLAESPEYLARIESIRGKSKQEATKILAEAELKDWLFRPTMQLAGVEPATSKEVRAAIEAVNDRKYDDRMAAGTPQVGTGSGTIEDPQVLRIHGRTFNAVKTTLKDGKTAWALLGEGNARFGVPEAMYYLQNGRFKNLQGEALQQASPFPDDIVTEQNGRLVVAPGREKTPPGVRMAESPVPRKHGDKGGALAELLGQAESGDGGAQEQAQVGTEVKAPVFFGDDQGATQERPMALVGAEDRPRVAFGEASVEPAQPLVADQAPKVGGGQGAASLSNKGKELRKQNDVGWGKLDSMAIGDRLHVTEENGDVSVYQKGYRSLDYVQEDGEFGSSIPLTTAHAASLANRGVLEKRGLPEPKAAARDRLEKEKRSPREKALSSELTEIKKDMESEVSGNVLAMLRLRQDEILTALYAEQEKSSASKTESPKEAIGSNIGKGLGHASDPAKRNGPDDGADQRLIAAPTESRSNVASAGEKRGVPASLVTGNSDESGKAKALSSEGVAHAPILSPPKSGIASSGARVRTTQGKIVYVPNAEETLRAYFKPGSIVHGYGGKDRVVSFDWNGGAWSVVVHAVDAKGDRATEFGQDRQHNTTPNDRELVAVLGKPDIAPKAKPAKLGQPSPAKAKPEPKGMDGLTKSHRDAKKSEPKAPTPEMPAEASGRYNGEETPKQNNQSYWDREEAKKRKAEEAKAATPQPVAGEKRSQPALVTAIYRAAENPYDETNKRFIPANRNRILQALEDAEKAGVSVEYTKPENRESSEQWKIRGDDGKGYLLSHHPGTGRSVWHELGQKPKKGASAAKAEKPEPTKPGWLGTLSAEESERVKAMMREIRREADAYTEKENKLKPRFNEVSVGAGEFDEFIKAYGLGEFLRGLNKGLSPDEAGAKAKVEIDYAVDRHNEKRKKDYNWQRAKGTDFPRIDYAVRRIKEALKAPADNTGTRGARIKALQDQKAKDGFLTPDEKEELTRLKDEEYDARLEVDIAKAKKSEAESTKENAAVNRVLSQSSAIQNTPESLKESIANFKRKIEEAESSMDSGNQRLRQVTDKKEKANLQKSIREIDAERDTAKRFLNKYEYALLAFEGDEAQKLIILSGGYADVDKAKMREIVTRAVDANDTAKTLSPKDRKAVIDKLANGDMSYSWWNAINNTGLEKTVNRAIDGVFTDQATEDARKKIEAMEGLEHVTGYGSQGKPGFLRDLKNAYSVDAVANVLKEATAANEVGLAKKAEDDRVAAQQAELQRQRVESLKEPVPAAQVAIIQKLTKGEYEALKQGVDPESPNLPAGVTSIGDAVLERLVKRGFLKAKDGGSATAWNMELTPAGQEMAKAVERYDARLKNGIPFAERGMVKGRWADAFGKDGKLIIGKANGRDFHSTGHWIVEGKRPAQAEGVEVFQELTADRLSSALTPRKKVEKVTPAAYFETERTQYVVMSNGSAYNASYFDYVSGLHPDAEFFGAAETDTPVYLKAKDGRTVGVIMPIRHEAAPGVQAILDAKPAEAEKPKGVASVDARGMDAFDEKARKDIQRSRAEREAVEALAEAETADTREEQDRQMEARANKAAVNTIPPEFYPLDAIEKKANRRGYDPEALTDSAMAELKKKGYVRGTKNFEITPEGRSRLQELSRLVKENEAASAEAHADEQERRIKAGTWIYQDDEPRAEKPAPAKEAPKAEPKKAIPDSVGEKIGGSRKDKWAARGLMLGDLEGMSGGEQAQLVTKENVWPKIDYAARIAAGMEPRAAALLKLLRDRVATAPRQAPSERTAGAVGQSAAQSRADYVEVVGALRDLAAKANTFAEVQGLAEAVSAAIGVKAYRGRAAEGLSDAEKAEQRKRYEKLWQLYGESSRNPLHVGSDVTRRADKLVATGWPKKAERATTTTADGEMKKIEPSRPHLDEIERTGEDVRAGRDVTSEEFMEHFGFRGVEFGNWAANDERQKLLNLAYEALHDLANVMGIPPKAISMNGTLGLALAARGGGKFAAHYEPGKLVINMTKINGAGSLAHEWGHALDHYFGEQNRPDAYQGAARGISGWYDKGTAKLGYLRAEVKAAFERVMETLFKKFQTKAEIIRDKELLLEKAQARLDEVSKMETTDNMSKNSKVAGMAFWNRQVESITKDIAKTRAEMAEDARVATGRSDYEKQAGLLSGKSVNGYWLRPTEMFARAFESFVFDRIRSDSRVSDYLVHGVEADRYSDSKKYKGNPYPTGTEREDIDAAFQNLVETIQTKETDKGVAMFERRDGQAMMEAEWTVYNNLGNAGMTKEAIRDAPPVVGAPAGVRVVDFQHDVPKSVLQQMERRSSAFVARVMEAGRMIQRHVPAFRFGGVTPAGNLHGVNVHGSVFINQIATHQIALEIMAKEGISYQEAFSREATNVLLHEAAHYAARGHGTEFETELARIKAELGDNGIRAIRMGFLKFAADSKNSSALSKMYEEALPGWREGERRGREAARSDARAEGNRGADAEQSERFRIRPRGDTGGDEDAFADDGRQGSLPLSDGEPARGVDAPAFVRGADGGVETFGLTRADAESVVEDEKPLKGWLLHGRRDGKFSNAWPIQLTQNASSANGYAAGQKGQVWAFRPNAKTRVADFTDTNTADMDAFIEALRPLFESGRVNEIRDQVAGSLGIEPDEVTFEQFEADVRDNFTPADIVDTAQAYDDHVSINLLEHYPGGYPDMVKTPDGGVIIPGAKGNVDGVNLTALAEEPDFSRKPSAPIRPIPDKKPKLKQEDRNTDRLYRRMMNAMGIEIGQNETMAQHIQRKGQNRLNRLDRAESAITGTSPALADHLFGAAARIDNKLAITESLLLDPIVKMIRSAGLDFDLLGKYMNGDREKVLKSGKQAKYDEAVQRIESVYNLADGLRMKEGLVDAEGLAKIQKKREKKRAESENHPLFEALQDFESVVIESEQNRGLRDLAAFVEKAQALGTVHEITEDEPAGDNAVEFSKDGAKWAIEFNDAAIAESVRGMHSDKLDGALRLVSKATRWVSRVNTILSPVFLIKNKVRDFGGAVLSAMVLNGAPNGIAKSVAWKIAAGQRQAMKGTRDFIKKPGGPFPKGSDAWWAQQAHQNAAIPGYFKSVESIERLESRLGDTLRGNLASKMSVRHFMDVMRDLSSLSEASTRVSVYRALVEAGETPQRAGNMARATLDTNKGGEWTRQIGALTPFFNSSVQGGARLVQMLTSTDPDVRKRAKSVLGGLVSAGAMLGTWLAMAGGDDDEDGIPDADQQPEWDAQRNLIVGGVKIPLPQGFSAPFYGGMMASKMLRGNAKPDEAGFQIAKAFWDQFAPISSPFGVAQPVADMLQNETFSGSPIRPIKYPGQTTPRSEMAFKSTSSVSKGIARGLNAATGGDEAEAGLIDVYPGYIDHMAKAGFGAVGRFLADSARATEALVQGKTPDKIPVVGDFLVDEDRNIRSRYYDAAEMVRDADSRRRGKEKMILKQELTERFPSATEKLDRANLTDLRKAMKEAGAQLSPARREWFQREMEEQENRAIRVKKLFDESSERLKALDNGPDSEEKEAKKRAIYEAANRAFVAAIRGGAKQ